MKLSEISADVKLRQEALAVQHMLIDMNVEISHFKLETVDGVRGIDIGFKTLLGRKLSVHVPSDVSGYGYAIRDQGRDGAMLAYDLHDRKELEASLQDYVNGHHHEPIP